MDCGLHTFRADLHIHTVLSPCGDIEMTPRRIVAKAKERGLDIIGICDHNSTRQCAEVEKAGKRENIFVLCGAEVTTREEVHCLAFFDTPDTLAAFQFFLEKNLPHIQNDVRKFGYQLVVDEEENVLDELPYLLINALSRSITEVAAEVRRLNGIFIPAHIDKARDSILSQLGFVPPDLQAEALELSKHTTVSAFLQQHRELADRHFIRSSDAHVPDDIGCVYTSLRMNEINFNEIKNALQNGRIS
jgi:PHP family Zn ribbon phosphoesterase